MAVVESVSKRSLVTWRQLEEVEVPSGHFDFLKREVAQIISTLRPLTEGQGGLLALVIIGVLSDKPGYFRNHKMDEETWDKAINRFIGRSAHNMYYGMFTTEDAQALSRWNLRLSELAELNSRH